MTPPRSSTTQETATLGRGALEAVFGAAATLVAAASSVGLVGTTRRLRLLGVLGALAVASLLAAPVALADPGQSGWGSGPERLFNACTNEYVDDTFNAHFVETASGPSHFNAHVVGVGETSGSTYFGESTGNAFVHALPDGTFLVDQIDNVRLVSRGSPSNS